MSPIWTERQRQIHRHRNARLPFYTDRSLLELTDRERYSPPLTRRERIRLAKGYAIATVLLLAFICAIALAGGSQ